MVPNAENLTLDTILSDVCLAMAASVGWYVHNSVDYVKSSHSGTKSVMPQL